MIKAVLLDLDNTLIRNPDQIFAPAFIRLVDQFFTEQFELTGMADALRMAMRAVSGLRDGEQTNSQVTLAAIAQTCAAPQSLIEEALAAFYDQAYASLRACVEPMAGALALIQALRARDLSIVIATNPIYPLRAILQRLEWAGLPSDPSAYAFVAHNDNMHFAKPDPAFYAEILGRVKVEPDEAVMVGDSSRNDIDPAKTLGIHTFWIRDATAEGRGRSILDFMSQLEAGWLDTLFPLPLSPMMIEPQLIGSLGALFGLLAGVRDNFWEQHPDPQEWSILQIVCHLLESEVSVQRQRLQTILSQDNPFILAPRMPPGPEAPNCADDGMVVAREFAAQRRFTINVLRQLTDDDWMRPARHSVFGPTSLLEMAHFTAQHDRLHLNQLCRTIGECR
jgi:FMN phosphatase YigB (HAD superfamily)